MVKLIILILANDSETYLECQKLWKLYMNSHPNVKSYFIKYNADLIEDVKLENDNIFIKGHESVVPGCLDKTIKSIEFCLKNLEFDFIFRTNMSSVVDLNKLTNLLENYNNQISGVIGSIENLEYASGAGMLICKKFCSDLILNKQSLDYNIIDDVSIGLFCKNHNVQICSLTRFETYNYENNLNLISKDLIKDYYHFRCKSGINENNTPLLMKKIIDLIYYTD
jgi:hypothetical protein